ncbi:hypothetical protein NAC44_04140 [Allorhizobium sp. BGMRC 0089]|uniref:hypothetical protein n=1 Tax=Allorhizobium sonneratiae TaxID=2934936 RepID=UPI0020336E38|nr:hypothetical protein [Allorhizobium sonneratiae]MCM2291516.1 hypothetical protein [Allorhizobium sonneratiae]
MMQIAFGRKRQWFAGPHVLQNPDVTPEHSQSFMISISAGSEPEIVKPPSTQGAMTVLYCVGSLPAAGPVRDPRVATVSKKVAR